MVIWDKSEHLSVSKLETAVFAAELSREQKPGSVLEPVLLNLEQQLLDKKPSRKWSSVKIEISAVR